MEVTRSGGSTFADAPAGELLFNVRCPRVMDLLIDRRAEVNQWRDDDETVLQNAIRCPHLRPVVEMLLERGAKWHASYLMDRRDPPEGSALHAAAAWPVSKGRIRYH